MATGSSNGDVSLWRLELLIRTLFTGVVFLRTDVFLRAAFVGVDNFFLRSVFAARFFPACFFRVGFLAARFFELARDVFFFFFVGIRCQFSTATRRAKLAKFRIVLLNNCGEWIQYPPDCGKRIVAFATDGKVGRAPQRENYRDVGSTRNLNIVVE